MDEEDSLLRVISPENYESFYKKPEDIIKVFKRRWYILTLFSILSFLGALVVNSWSPIANSANEVFKFGDTEITLLSLWSFIQFIPSLIPVSWLLNNKGLRVSIIFAATIMCIGAGIKIVSQNALVTKWLIHIGQLLNGVAGIIMVSGVTMLSVTWFSVKQRIIATTIANCASNLGIAGAFLFGPLIVSEPITNTSGSILHNDTASTVLYHEIMQMLYVEFGFVMVFLILIILYFPLKPPKPPSITASLPRYGFREGFQLLFRNKNFWLVSLSFGSLVGVFIGFEFVLFLFLQSFGVTQEEAGWIGFYSIIAGIISGLLVSWCVDRFRWPIKIVIIMLQLGATASIISFKLLNQMVIGFSKAHLYLIVICQSVFISASTPLYYELANEVVYPVSEGLSTSAMNFLATVAISVFLIIRAIVSTNAAWMIWFLLAGSAISIPLLIFVKGNYHRLNIDQS